MKKIITYIYPLAVPLLVTWLGSLIGFSVYGKSDISSYIIRILNDSSFSFIAIDLWAVTTVVESHRLPNDIKPDITCILTTVISLILHLLLYLISIIVTVNLHSVLLSSIIFSFGLFLSIFIRHQIFINVEIWCVKKNDKIN